MCSRSTMAVLMPELGGADGRDVAAGAGADDDQIVLVSHLNVPSPSGASPCPAAFRRDSAASADWPSPQNPCVHKGRAPWHWYPRRSARGRADWSRPAWLPPGRGASCRRHGFATADARASIEMNHCPAASHSSSTIGTRNRGRLRGNGAICVGLGVAEQHADDLAVALRHIGVAPAQVFLFVQHFEPADFERIIGLPCPLVMLPTDPDATMRRDVDEQVPPRSHQLWLPGEW